MFCFPFIEYQLEKAMFDAEIARLKAEHQRDIVEIKCRLETVTKENNDKLDAICAHLGIKLEKVPPVVMPYRVVSIEY